MKQFVIPFILGLLLLVGCGGEDVVLTETAVDQLPSTTPTAQLPVATVPTASPIILPTAKLPIATPELLEITNTPPPPTDTPILIPTVTSSPTLRPTSTAVALDPSLPMPTGHIYFLWDPNPIPEVQGAGLLQQNNLYKAIPGNAPNDWHIETAIEIFGYPFMVPAPDSAKLAIVQSHDINGDGIFNMYDVPRQDPLNIFVYSAIDNSSIQLTDNEWKPGAISWLPDSQRISYAQLENVLLAELVNSTHPENLYVFDGYVYELAVSPDGDNIAIISSGGNSPYSSKLDILTLDNSQTSTLFDDIKFDLKLAWSFGGQWLALNRGLSIVDVNTREIIELVPYGEPAFFEWSPVSPQLGFVYTSTLFLWDSNTNTIQELASDVTDNPVWSSDGSTVAVKFIANNQSGILVLNPEQGESQRIELDMISHIVSWSPDGQWLLFSSESDDQSGLYMVHKDGDTPFLFLETTGKKLPHDLYWLAK